MRRFAPAAHTPAALAPAALALVPVLALGGCSSSDTAASLAPVGAPPAVAVALPESGGAQRIAADPAAPDGALALAAPVVSAAPAAVNAAIASTRLSLAPVLGAPSGAAGPLGRAIAERARQVGLETARGGGTHTLKGFFSVNDDGREVRVVYIWDVLDPSNRRVHRIRGQEVIAGTQGGRDPWRAVTPAVMERIGRITVDRFAGWRGA